MSWVVSSSAFRSDFMHPWRALGSVWRVSPLKRSLGLGLQTGGIIAELILIGLAAGACSSDKNLKLGQQVFNENCKVCHLQGVNGAPVLGNRKMWTKRAAQGEKILTEHAVNGYGLMPAKGGKSHLADQDIAMAVRYMLSRLERD
jgi:cytochrome c5